MKTNKHNMKFLTGLFSTFWLLTVFIAYGYTHKPFLPEELIGRLLILWRTLSATTIISLAGGIGMSMHLRQQGFSPLTQAMLSSAFGLGIISISVLIISATIGINFSLWIFLIAAIIIFRKGILLWWKLFQDLNNFWLGTSKSGRVGIFLMIIILICQYLEALAPPLQFDALTYHLVQ